MVEDDTTNFLLVQKLLERIGIEVEWAQDGLQAIESFRVKPVEVILMDLQMPELDGVEATLRIREMCSDQAQPYIIALTANALQGSRDACKQAGMQDFLTKPVTGEAIRMALLRFQHQQDMDLDQA